MDTTRNNYPILSYCSSLLEPNSNPPLPHEFHETISTTFPYLTDPKVFTALTQAIPSNILQTQTLLNALGPRPSLDAVSSARIKMAQIEETGGGDAKEAEIYRALVRLEEMHRDHERQAKEVEERLVEVYREVAKEMEGGGEVNEEVVRVLKELESGGVVERLDLSGRNLRLLPEAFGWIRGLLVLDLSRSELEVLPDSIGGLEKLEVLDVSSNVLASLPDSIGLLHNLKILNVSGNKLRTLPESIALCSSLVELDASFNNLTFLPINIGYGLPNLERLSIQLNKIRILPASICEMKSLKYLDVHFNEIRGLPHAIGRLINLEFLNVSSNFSDFTELPETLGDLANLRELDVSNNQIRALPDSFGRLEKLTKLNLEENPLEVPPKEIVNKEAQAVREFMAKRWQEMIAEEQQRSMLKANQQQDQTGWLAWGTSLLNNFVSGASQSVSGYLGEKAPKDPYLDQLL